MSDVDVDVIEILDRFELVWNRGRRPALAKYLLPAGHRQRRELLFDLVKSELEYRLKSGDESPLVEGYLSQYPTELGDSATALQLIALEYQWRWRRESGVRQKEYLDRFPQYADALSAFLKLERACPVCKLTIEIADETADTFHCSLCEKDFPIRLRAADVQTTEPLDPDWPRIDGYRILAKLGVGGMAVVFKARELRTGREVAIKMILSGPHATAELRGRFRDEVKAVAHLDHPHVVKIYHVDEVSGQPYAELEYVDGGSLERKLAAKPQPARNAATLVELLARTMHFVHEQGIVHRDLKPANVLLASRREKEGVAFGDSASEKEYFQPKITDFGLAKLRVEGANDLTATNAVLGTADYMSPEQALGKTKDASFSADIYALGVILYEMLTGHPPLRGVTFNETLQLVANADPMPPRRLQPTVPRDLETIALKCLRKDPAKRYDSALALADDLRRFLDGVPIVGRPVSSVEHAVNWVRRHPVAATVLAASVLTVLIVVAGFIGFHYQQEANSVAHAKELMERQKATHAAGLVEGLLDCEIDKVTDKIAEFKDYRPWADPLLEEAYANATREGNASRQLRVALALMPVDKKHLDFIYVRLLDAEPKEVAPVRQALASVAYREELIEKLWKVIDQPEKEGQRLRAASALAPYAPKDQHWNEAAGPIVAQLVTVNLVFLERWINALEPVKEKLVNPLSEIFRDQRVEKAAEAQIAAFILAEYAAADPKLLADLVMDADVKQFGVLWPKLKVHSKFVVPYFEKALEKDVAANASEEVKASQGNRQANAALALLKFGRPEKVWGHLQHRPDPRVRSQIVCRMAILEIDPDQLVRRLFLGGAEREGKPWRWAVERLLFNPENSLRRALLLGLGEFRLDQLAAADQQLVLARLPHIYREDPDPGIHGSVEWLLRRWKQGDRIREIDQGLKTGKVEGKRGWYVNRHDDTMVVVPGPVEALIGSPPEEKDREGGPTGPTEIQVRRLITRSFAIAPKEVTVGQFLRFRPEHPYDKHYAPTEDYPVIGRWYEAAAYCNWLSKQEGIDPKEWCFLPNGEGKYAEGMKLAPGYLSRTGYRLPTEAEWEFACRAGAVTSRYYGEGKELLENYAWYTTNSKDEKMLPVGSKKPNDLGLFDTLGNAYEWTLGMAPDPTLRQQAIEDAEVTEDTHAVKDAPGRVLRGGSFLSYVANVRAAHRNWLRPSTPSKVVGFRLARTMP